MLTDGTQAFECCVGCGPSGECSFHRLNDSLEGWKVSVVQAQSARQFPYPFNRVEVGTVGWQELKSESPFLFSSPLGMEIGMMKLRVINDHDDPSSGATTGQTNLLEKRPRGLRVG